MNTCMVGQATRAQSSSFPFPTLISPLRTGNWLINLPQCKSAYQPTIFTALLGLSYPKQL